MAFIVPNLPMKKQKLLHRTVNQLRQVAGIAAVALGGSYASGTQRKDSDLDIGLYYYEESPFAIEAVRQAAQQIAGGGSPTVTGFYEWGAWVNGGAWIHTPEGKIDFLYRNIDQVQKTISDARQGIIYHDYDQQPSNGFYSVMYLAETRVCIPLYDPKLVLQDLKEQVKIYPPNLKQSIIASSLWSAEFSLLHARGFASRGDIYNTAGCLVRVAANLTQALFALNERYFIREKMVMEEIASFPILPVGYVQQIKGILARPGSTKPGLMKAVIEMEKAWQSVASLPGVQYKPRFTMQR